MKIIFRRTLQNILMCVHNFSLIFFPLTLFFPLNSCAEQLVGNFSTSCWEILVSSHLLLSKTLILNEESFQNFSVFLAW